MTFAAKESRAHGRPGRQIVRGRRAQACVRVSNRGIAAAMRALAPGSARNRAIPPLGGLSTRHEQEADRLARSTDTATGRSPAVREPMHPLRASPGAAACTRTWAPATRLDRANRVHLERRLGFDLGDVVVHRGDAAHRGSKSLEAQAWTSATIFS
jgi:hypothetical protein